MSELIKPRNSLKSDFKKSDIINKILEKIMKFENIQKYKLDSNFCELVCNLIEHFVKKKYNINKKELLIDVYNKIFNNLTEDDKTTIYSMVDYIFNNGLIKKLSYYKLFVSYFSNWIKKKVL